VTPPAGGRLGYELSFVAVDEGVYVPVTVTAEPSSP
jgi:hypothetical protein